MAEPATSVATSVAPFAASVVASTGIVGQVLGIDPAHLWWGALGGLWMIASQRTTEGDSPPRRSNWVVIVAVAALVAGLGTGIVVHYLMPLAPGLPRPLIEHATAAVIGLIAQGVAPWILKIAPRALRFFSDRLFGRPTGGSDAPR